MPGMTAVFRPSGRWDLSQAARNLVFCWATPGRRALGLLVVTPLAESGAHPESSLRLGAQAIQQ